MTKPERRDGKFQRDHIAHHTAGVARGVCGAEGIVVAVAGVNDALNHGWVAHVLEVTVDHEPLIVQRCQGFGGLKVRDPGGLVFGQKIDDFVMEPQEAEVELRDDDVFIVAHVADQGALGQAVFEFVEILVVHLGPRDVECGVADLLFNLVKARKITVRIQRIGQIARGHGCAYTHLGRQGWVAQARAEDRGGLLFGLAGKGADGHAAVDAVEIKARGARVLEVLLNFWAGHFGGGVHDGGDRAFAVRPRGKFMVQKLTPVG